MGQKNTICQKIVDAARERFSHYGYCKTTMSEIAADCNMSPGNIYRFFPGKLDIAEKIAEENTDRRLEAIREVVRDPSLTACERLHAFLFDALRVTYTALDEDPRVTEIAHMLSRERPDFSERQLAKERALICEILTAGNASGEFDIDDVLVTARLIQAATLKYKYPQLHSALRLEQLEAELEGVIDLITNGLKARPEDMRRPPAAEKQQASRG